MKYYHVTEMKELLTCAMTWMNSTGMVLSERDLPAHAKYLYVHDLPEPHFAHITSNWQ